MDALMDPALVHSEAQNAAAYDTQVKHENNDIKTEPALADGDEEMQDLFGDEDAEEKQEAVSVQEEERSLEPDREGSEALSASELQHRKNLEYEEDDGHGGGVVELKHAVLSIPNIPAPRSSDGNTWIFRLPNFVKLDPKPFSPDTYVGPDQVEDENQRINSREKSMSIKLEVENTLRWRWQKDPSGGADKRVSNSRIIRWSDGTLSMLLGKELFDVNQNFENPTGAQRQGSSTQLSQSQLPPSTQPTTTVKGGAGLTYIVAQHKRPGILQTEAPVTGYMSLRPTGMQSETHRLLARAVGQKHSKVARLRMAPDPVVDPELEKAELLKQAARKPRARRAEGGEGGSVRRKRAAYGRRRESVWSDEEPEPGAFGDSDEDEDGGGDGERRRTRSGGSEAKRGAGEYQTDDFLVSDSDGEGAEEGSDEESQRKKKGKRKHRSSEDALDEMDAKIERNERRKKRDGETAAEGDDAQGGISENASGNMDMDVESEDEENFDISRTGTSGVRRKRAIAIDDEEEE